MLAILTRLRDQRAAVKRVLARIATLELGAREAILAKLLVLAVLRKPESTIRTELDTMPTEESIMDHEIIGPAIQKVCSRKV